MHARRYLDGVVVYDPVDGHTYALPEESFEIVELVVGMIDSPWPDSEQVVAKVAAEVHGGDGQEPTADELANLRRWVDLALHLRR